MAQEKEGWFLRMSSKTEYDSSWDKDNHKLWDKKYKEWKERESEGKWQDWLEQNLSFPFEVKRVEDLSSNPFKEKDEPFDVGHIMKLIAIDCDEDHYGIIVKVREGRKTAYLPLCDLEVTSKDDPNFWPVRKYVVWFANR